MTSSINSKINYSSCPSSKYQHSKKKKSPQETPANFPTSPEVYDLNNFIKKNGFPKIGVYLIVKKMVEIGWSKQY